MNQRKEEGAALGDIWPSAVGRDDAGAVDVRSIPVEDLAERYGTPLYLMDTSFMADRARIFRETASRSLPTATTQVSYAGKAFLSKEVVRIMLDRGLNIDTCTLGEMLIAKAAGAPGRRLVLHGNNKSDREISLAIEEGYGKIVIDAADEPERIADIAHGLGRRARVMLRVTVGVHAGGHEYISTSHEDQKFGVPMLAPGADASPLDRFGAGDGQESMSRTAEVGDGVLSANSSDLFHVGAAGAPINPVLAAALDTLANGPAIKVLKDIQAHADDLELVGIHTHIGSQIHGDSAFGQAANRMMLLRRTFWETDGFLLPEVDLGGGFSVPYLPDEDRMDLSGALGDLGLAIGRINDRLGMPMPIISFEPGRWIAGPSGMTLYRVGTVKPVPLSDGTVRTYVSVDGGMSDNIRPALYGADYTAVLANRRGSSETIRARVVGKHCESGDIIVRDVSLPKDIRRGDLLLVPVTGAYGRTMANNYNQVLMPPVVAVDGAGDHLMLRGQAMDDLLELDQG